MTVMNFKLDQNLMRFAHMKYAGHFDVRIEEHESEIPTEFGKINKKKIMLMFTSYFKHYAIPILEQYIEPNTQFNLTIFADIKYQRIHSHRVEYRTIYLSPNLKINPNLNTWKQKLITDWRLLANANKYVSLDEDFSKRSEIDWTRLEAVILEKISIQFTVKNPRGYQGMAGGCGHFSIEFQQVDGITIQNCSLRKNLNSNNHCFFDVLKETKFLPSDISITGKWRNNLFKALKREPGSKVFVEDMQKILNQIYRDFKVRLSIYLTIITDRHEEYEFTKLNGKVINMVLFQDHYWRKLEFYEEGYKKAKSKPYHQHCNQCGAMLRKDHVCEIEEIALVKETYDVEAYIKESLDNILEYQKYCKSNPNMHNEELFQRHHHVYFLAGSAGSGKSTVLQRYEQLMMEQDQHVVKLAYTAIAASLINGITVHKFTKCYQEYQSCKYFFIDEISMLSSELFTKVMDKIGKRFTIIAGDFNQLQFIPDKQNTQSIVENSIFETCQFYYMYQNLRYLEMSAEEESFLKNINNKRLSARQFLKVFKEDQVQPIKILNTKTIHCCDPVLCNTNKEVFEITKKLYENSIHLEGIIHQRTFDLKEELKELIGKQAFKILDEYDNKVLSKDRLKYIDVIFPHVFYPGQQLRITRNVYIENNNTPLFINNSIWEFKGINHEYDLLILEQNGRTVECSMVPFTLSLNGQYYGFFPVIAANVTTIFRAQGLTFDRPYFIKLNTNSQFCNILIVALTRATRLKHITFLLDGYKENGPNLKSCLNECSGYFFLDYNLMEELQKNKPYGKSYPIKCILNEAVNRGEFNMQIQNGFISVERALPLTTSEFQSPCSDKQLLGYFTVFYDLETGYKPKHSKTYDWEKPNVEEEKKKLEIIPYCVGFIILHKGKRLDLETFFPELNIRGLRIKGGIYRIMANEETMPEFIKIIGTLIKYYHTLIQSKIEGKSYQNFRWKDKIKERCKVYHNIYIPPITMIAHNGARFDSYFCKRYIEGIKAMIDFEYNEISIPGTGSYSDMAIEACVTLSTVGEQHEFKSSFQILHHWDSVKFSLCSLADSVKSYMGKIDGATMKQYCNNLSIDLPEIEEWFNKMKGEDGNQGKDHFPHKACLKDIAFAEIQKDIPVHKSFYFDPPDSEEIHIINPYDKCQKYITLDVQILMFLVIIIEHTRLFDEGKESSSLRFITVQQKLKNDVYCSNKKITCKPEKEDVFVNGCQKNITNIPKSPIKLSNFFDMYLYGGITLPRVHIYGPSSPMEFSVNGYEPYFKGDINGMYSYVQSFLYYPTGQILETNKDGKGARNIFNWIKRQEQKIKDGEDPDKTVMLARRNTEIPKFFIMEATYKWTNCIESPMSFRKNKDLYHGVTPDNEVSTRILLTDYVSCAGLIMFGWELISIEHLFTSEGSDRVYKETVEEFDRIKKSCSPGEEFENPAKRNAAKLDSNALYGLNLRKDNDLEIGEFNIKDSKKFNDYMERIHQKKVVVKTNITTSDSKVYAQLTTDMKNREYSDFSTSHGYMTLKGSHMIINRAMVYGYGKYLVPKTKEEFEQAIKHRPLYGDTDSLVMPHCYLLNLWNHDLMILEDMDLTPEEKDECCFFYHKEYRFLRPGGKFEDEEKKDKNYIQDIPNKMYTHIQGFVTNAPKSYSLMAVSPNNQVHFVTKIKGIPGNSSFKIDSDIYQFKKGLDVLYKQFHFIFTTRATEGLVFKYNSIVRQGIVPYVKLRNEDEEYEAAKHFSMFADILTRTALNDWEVSTEELKYKRMNLVDNVFLPIGFNINGLID
jgi:hypothetical protein